MKKMTMTRKRKSNPIAKVLSDPIFRARTVVSKIRKEQLKYVPKNKILQEAESYNEETLQEQSGEEQAGEESL